MNASGAQIQAAKAYLNELRKAGKLIARLARMAREARSSLDIRGVDYSRATVNGGEKKDIGDRISSVLTYEQELNEQIRALVQRRAKALSLMANVKDFDERSTLIARYLDGREWPDIVEETGFCASWVYALNKRGIEDFAAVNAGELEENN